MPNFSPAAWARHEKSYSTPEYNDFFAGQLTELLTNYGEIFEYWFDGARDSNLPDPGYDSGRWYRTVEEYQPDALIFGGADIRWVGNEDGFSPQPQWSAIEVDRWFPAECDVRNRPGWFWKKSDDSQVLSGLELLDIYFTSVGGNCVLLLNVPVNDQGLISEPDIRELRVFRHHLDTIFGDNLIRYGEATASSTGQDTTGWVAQNAIDGKSTTFWVAQKNETTGWIEIALEEAITFNIVSLQEPIQYGQRVSGYLVQALTDDFGWVSVSEGTTIGYKKLDRMTEPVTTKKIRLNITNAVGTPAIQEFALFYADM